MNILPLIPRKLNLGVERFSEIALSMREPIAKGYKRWEMKAYTN